jgi:hypothetical protein
MDLVHIELEIQVIIVSIHRYTFGIIQSEDFIERIFRNRLLLTIVVGVLIG